MSCKLFTTGRIGTIDKKEFNGGSVVNFSVASDRSYKGKDGNWVNEVEWTNFEAWGSRGEYIAKNLGKGDIVEVMADKTSSKVEKDGKTVTYTHYKVASIERLAKNQKNGGSAQGNGNTNQFPSAPDIDEEEIPF